MKKEELFKLTVPKLREEALKVEGMVGVHGMDKPELIRALADHFGLDITEHKAKMVATAPLKKQVKELRVKKAEAKAAGDKKRADILRKKIKRLKHRTRV
jgi:hypothetical protein